MAFKAKYSRNKHYSHLIYVKKYEPDVFLSAAKQHYVLQAQKS